MRILFTDTHNVVEGAGAASLAALLQDRGKIRVLTAGIVLTGANVDPQPFARILNESAETTENPPEPRRTSPNLVEPVEPCRTS
jgi:threonine dehydratase